MSPAKTKSNIMERRLQKNLSPIQIIYQQSTLDAYNFSFNLHFILLLYAKKIIYFFYAC